MHINQATRVVATEAEAIAIMICLIRDARSYEMKVIPGGGYSITTNIEGAAVLNDAKSPTFGLFQEGGSSGEIYLHTYPTLDDAHTGAASCNESAYRTTEPFEISPALDAVGENFYEMLTTIAVSIVNMQNG